MSASLLLMAALQVAATSLKDEKVTIYEDFEGKCRFSKVVGSHDSPPHNCFKTVRESTATPLHAASKKESS